MVLVVSRIFHKKCTSHEHGSSWQPEYVIGHFIFIRGKKKQNTNEVCVILSVVVQSHSHVWLFATPWTAARQAYLSMTNSRNSPKLMCIELVMPSSHLILCRPILLLPSIFPSIRVFSNQVLHVRWPKCWSYSLSINSSNEYYISSILIIIYNFISSYIEIHQYLWKSRTKKYNRGKI